MYSTRSEDIHMNDEEIRTVKSLKDGGVYKVRFKPTLEPSLYGEWMKCLNHAVVGRNITFVAEVPECFEIIGDESNE